MNQDIVKQTLDCVFLDTCNQINDQNLLEKNLLVERVLCRNNPEQKYCLENKRRVHNFGQLIQNIASYCLKNDIRYYFPKAYQHYPDMGHDVDLFIDIKGEKLLDFIHNFQLEEDKSSFLNRIAGKRPYLFDGGIPVETHRFAGHFGEFKHLTQTFYNNLIVDRGVNQLCDEHKLLNQIIQRFYGHFTIRLSDIIFSINLLNKGVDLISIEKEASKYGLNGALYEYLGFIFGNFEHYIQSNDYSDFKRIKSKYIYFSRDMFFVNKGFALKLFILKSLSDLMNFRVFSLTRLSTVPFVLTAMVFRRIFNK